MATLVAVGATGATCANVAQRSPYVGPRARPIGYACAVAPAFVNGGGDPATGKGPHGAVSSIGGKFPLRTPGRQRFSG